MCLKWINEGMGHDTSFSTRTVSKNYHYRIGRRAGDNMTERQVALLGSIDLLWCNSLVVVAVVPSMSFDHGPFHRKGTTELVNLVFRPVFRPRHACSPRSNNLEKKNLQTDLPLFNQGKVC